MEDEHIVDLYLARDEEAIRQTAEKYGGQMRSLSLGIVQDIQTAQECENDTYFHAWNAIPPHEPRSYLFAFLARIVRQLSLNRCRDRERLKRGAFVCRLSEEMEECLPAPDDVECRMDEAALKEVIDGFLRSSGEDVRNVFLCRYWYLDSIRSISRRSGYSESKVKTMLHRSRKQLRTYLEKEGYVL